jgi:hypothetical protein
VICTCCTPCCSRASARDASISTCIVANRRVPEHVGMLGSANRRLVVEIQADAYLRSSDGHLESSDDHLKVQHSTLSRAPPSRWEDEHWIVEATHDPLWLGRPANVSP